MQEAEARAFAAGASAADLMEQAGAGIARAIAQFEPRPGSAVLYLGKGNNAGDALVAARHLLEQGWRLHARLSAPVEDFKPLPRQHWEALAGRAQVQTQAFMPGDFPPGPLIQLDGLLGIGASGPLRGNLGELADEMNRLRQSARARTYALDLPSGLDGDSGLPGAGAVIADATLTVAHVKRGLVADAAINHTGRLAVVPLPELTEVQGDDEAEVSHPAMLRGLLPRRSFDAHKGQAGRVLVLAGSPGLLGAAELACRGALRAGAGLVTLAVQPEIHPLLAVRVPAEVMVRAVSNLAEALTLPHDAVVIGPGLGRARDAEIRQVLAADPAPAVVDADALNALAPWPVVLPMPGPRLLTPHPGEWRRLAPELAASAEDRRGQVEAFAAVHPNLTVLLKGARTVIAQQGRPTRYNSTGHPGMAAGGMGDALSGVLGALLGQGICAADSAALGAWLCGRAAEVTGNEGHEMSVLPEDVIGRLGRAFRDLVEGAY